jgi:hypothetical protein
MLPGILGRKPNGAAREVKPMDLRDLIGAYVVGGVEGGRTDSFHTIYIRCKKDGKKYKMEAPHELNMRITEVK